VEQGKEECTECYKGGNCTGGHRVFALDGYWKAKKLSGNVYRCQFLDACPGGEEPTCAEGYTGRLCGQCADGYAKLRSECLPCGASQSTFQQWSPGIFFVSAILLAVLGYGCANSLKEDEFLPTVQASSSKHVNVALTKNPVHSASGSGSGAGSGTAMRIPSSPSSPLSPGSPHTPGSPNSPDRYYESDSEDEFIDDGEDDVQEQTTKDAERAAVGKLRVTGMVKILTSYAQVICLTIIAMPVVPWPTLFVQSATPLQAMILDVFEMVPTGCMIGDIPFWAKYATIIFLFLILNSVFMIRMRMQVRAKVKESEKEALMGKKHSATVCLAEAEEARCNNYSIMFAILFMMYPVMANASFEVFSCRGIEDKWYLSSDMTIECYVATEWLICAAITGLMLPVVIVGLPWFVYSLLSRNRHKLGRKKQQGRYGFVYMSYSKEFWYWDIMEMARKICQTTLVMFVMPGSTFQVAFALVVSYFFVALQFKNHPFRDPVLNQLQTVSLFAETMTIFCGLMLKAFDSAVGTENEAEMFQGYDKDVCEYMLYAVNVLAVGLMVKIVVQSTATFGELAAKEVDQALEKRAQVNLMKAERQIAMNKKKEKYNTLRIEAIVVNADEDPMPEEWETPPEIDEFTETVNIELFVQSLNQPETGLAALEDLERINKETRKLLKAECEGYIAERFSNRCMWFLAKFEEYRYATAQTGPLKGREWPPATEECLAETKEDIQTAWEMAGLDSVRETLINEFDQHFASSVGYNNRLMEKYTGSELTSAEIAHLKSHLRDIANAIAGQMVSVALPQFKGQLDQTMSDAKIAIKEQKATDLDKIITKLFDRHSYDGEKLLSLDELNDLITGVIFRCQDVLPPKSLDLATKHAEGMKSRVERGMTCPEFIEWFRDHVVSPKTPHEKISQAVQQSEMTQASETSTATLIEQFEKTNSTDPASPRGSTKAKGKLQDRIAARRKKLQDKKTQLNQDVEM